jgi:hypothetical protein
MAPSASGAAPGADSSSAASAKRVARLEGDVRDLQGVIRALELRLAAQYVDTPEPLPTVDERELLERVEALEYDLVSTRGTEVASMGGGVLVDDVVQAVEYLREQEEAAQEAERAERQEQRLTERMAELTELLGLNPWQQAELERLLIDAESERNALREQRDGEGDRESRRAGYEALAEDWRTRSDEILTSEQAALLAEQGGLRFGGNRRGRRGNGDR